MNCVSFDKFQNFAGPIYSTLLNLLFWNIRVCSFHKFEVRRSLDHVKSRNVA